MIELGEIIDVLTDYTANGSFASLKDNVQYKNTEDYAVLVRLTDLRKNLVSEDMVYVPENSYKFLKKSSLFGGEYLIANVGANIGDAYLMPKINKPATLGPNMYLVKFNQNVIEDYVYSITESVIKPQIMKASVSAAQPKINKDVFRKIKIPLPDLEQQKKIVSEYKTESDVIKTNTELIKIMENKISETLNNI
jgi:type I restriction enzyme S subunit